MVRCTRRSDEDGCLCLLCSLESTSVICWSCVGDGHLETGSGEFVSLKVSKKGDDCITSVMFDHIPRKSLGATVDHFEIPHFQNLFLWRTKVSPLLRLLVVLRVQFYQIIIQIDRVSLIGFATEALSICMQ